MSNRRILRSRLICIGFVILMIAPVAIGANNERETDGLTNSNHDYEVKHLWHFDAPHEQLVARFGAAYLNDNIYFSDCWTGLFNLTDGARVPSRAADMPVGIGYAGYQRCFLLVHAGTLLMAVSHPDSSAPMTAIWQYNPGDKTWTSLGEWEGVWDAVVSAMGSVWAFDSDGENCYEALAVLGLATSPRRYDVVPGCVQRTSDVVVVGPDIFFVSESGPFLLSHITKWQVGSDAPGSRVGEDIAGDVSFVYHDMLAGRLVLATPTEKVVVVRINDANSLTNPATYLKPQWDANIKWTDWPDCRKGFPQGSAVAWREDRAWSISRNVVCANPVHVWRPINTAP